MVVTLLIKKIYKTKPKFQKKTKFLKLQKKCQKDFFKTDRKDKKKKKNKFQNIIKKNLIIQKTSKHLKNQKISKKYLKS